MKIKPCLIFSVQKIFLLCLFWFWGDIWHFFVVISSPMYMCVCRFLVVSRRRRFKASSLSLMWQEYWQGHTDEEEEIFIRNALAMGRLMTWDWLQHYHYHPEIQPIKVRTLQSPHATIHLIFHHSFGCKLWKCSVSFHRNCFERFTDWIPPPSPLRSGAGRWESVALVTGKVSAKWQESNCRFNFSN